MYPLELPSDWQLAIKNSALNAHTELKHWICSEDSLTARIKSLGNDFSIEVLNQSFVDLSAEQQKAVDTSDRMALVREVMLKQGKTPLIYAQTIIPESTLISTNQRLAELGNSSLGDLLFNNPDCTRGQIEVAQIHLETTLSNFITDSLNQTANNTCFMRRSRFVLNGKPLLVNEGFLPALERLIVSD